MNIAVIGGTGATGQEVVKLLIAQGDSITILARSPEKVDNLGGAVKVVKGDVRDGAALQAALSGQDAVISALGTRSPKEEDLQTVFIKNLLVAARATSVKRFVYLSAWGAGDSAESANIVTRLVTKTVLKRAFADKNRAEPLVTASDLVWTLVRPGTLKNKAGKGKDSVRASLDGKGLSSSIARADVAAFLVDQLSTHTWERQMPIIGY